MVYIRRKKNPAYCFIQGIFIGCIDLLKFFGGHVIFLVRDIIHRKAGEYCDTLPLKRGRIPVRTKQHRCKHYFHFQYPGKMNSILFEHFLQAKHIRLFGVQKWIDTIPMFRTFNIKGDKLHKKLTII